jgi:hypothetical protein
MTTIAPCHVYAHVALLQGELEPIRQELGRPRDDRARYQITGAAPREVYFVAQALFARADRLATEHTGAHAAMPPGTVVSSIEPAHVFSVVNAALGCVVQVKARLGLEVSITSPAAEPSRQPSDCMNAILLVNRQLDRLLARPVTPGDVDEQLAVAETHALAMLGIAGAPVPPRPALERRKRPGDVHARLITVLRALRPAIAGAGGTMLDAKDSPIAIDDVIPSDCYDLASLIAGELIYLHAIRRGPLAAAHRLDPGPRLPSHCYQRASRIEAAVTALARGG